jgi:neutral ceramidase
MRSVFLAVLFVAFWVSAAVAQEKPLPQPPSLKAGFAERDISPAIGMEQPGGYGKAFHRQIHDPCKVRAVVFDDGKQRVALVGVDALFVRRQLVEAVRKEIEEKCGIPPQAILIGASHSHTSGPTGMVLPGEFDGAPPLVRTLAYEKSSCADAKYLALVHKQIVAAVCEADARRATAQCGVGAGTEDKVSFNRRFRMKNGLCYTHPGKGNPDIVAPAGPIDPQVGVIGAWDPSGKLAGCVVNFACHATTGAPGSSANWIYWMEKAIRGNFGQDVIVVFLQGACGDVTQVNNLSTSPDPDGPIVGGRVGAEAVKALLSMPRGALGPLAAKTTTLTIPRRAPRPEKVAKCRELAAKDPGVVGATTWTFAKETVLLDYLLSREPTAKVEVQAIQVGPAVFLSNPAEFFCQLGLDMKSGSPFKFTFPVELANDCVGYVPTEEALGPHGGGYETRLTGYSNLAPTAGPQIVRAAVGLARQLTPGDVPQPPKSPAWAAPWEYGNVPPEVE